ncbi:hypothetical protein [Algoriphagus sp. PAP.12]|uniref:hypothetical protein n=1 Tax=Algoriphagus sp. PAP.12 TaxID=2996678 RepID=UPI00227ABB44|nr:hypothetical protein [Algoriphagus sp. PAP.12]
MKIRLASNSGILTGILWVFLVSFTLYFLIKNIPYGVDIKIHNLFLVEYLQKGAFPIPPGYYFLIYLVDFLVHYKYPFVLSSILVLTFFIWWKYQILKNWIKVESSFSQPQWLAFIWMFSFPIVIPMIDKDFWYLGKFTPTIWHNSTSIAAFPFALLLFRETILWWDKNSLFRFLKIIALGLAILLIKPSFLFCFIPLFPAFTLGKKGWKSPQFLQAVLFATIMIALIWFEKYLIYSWDPILQEDYRMEDRPRIVVEPFRIWLHYAFEPFWDFISSFLLTIIFLAFWGKEALKNQAFSFSFALLLMGLTLYFMLAETGYREWHANFYWQIPVTLFIHQVLMVLIVRKEFVKTRKKINLQTGLFMLVFFLQILSGLAYWIRIFVDRTIS